MRKRIWPLLALSLCGCASSSVQQSRDELKSIQCAEDASMPAALHGEWRTNWGPLWAEQQGRDVSGQYYENRSGSFTGTLTGNLLEFNWQERSLSGTGRFVICPGATRFSGYWTQGTRPNWWNGIRVAEAPAAPPPAPGTASVAPQPSPAPRPAEPAPKPVEKWTPAGPLAPRLESQL